MRKHVVTIQPIVVARLVAAGVLALGIFVAGCGKPAPVPDAPAIPAAAAQAQPAAPATSPVVPPLAGKPRLLDLGAHQCVPCKMMAPILEDLKANYADRFETIFVDVWDNPTVGQEYGVRSIPTQIFFDADGKERFRHVGFLAKEDILAKWQELGVDIGK